MAERMATRLEAFFDDRVPGRLRSIVKYEEREYDIVYLREDVAQQYTEGEIQGAMDEAVVDSIAAPLYGHVFADDHGDLTCLVQCYENVVELNFVLSEGVGAAVALDEGALRNESGLIDGARQILIETREE